MRFSDKCKTKKCKASSSTINTFVANGFNLQTGSENCHLSNKVIWKKLYHLHYRHAYKKMMEFFSFRFPFSLKVKLRHRHVKLKLSLFILFLFFNNWFKKFVGLERYFQNTFKLCILWGYHKCLGGRVLYIRISLMLFISLKPNKTKKKKSKWYKKSNFEYLM